MNILLCSDIGKDNQYVEILSSSYQKNNFEVILGVNNFFFSNFLPDILHIQWPEALYRWNHRFPENKDTLKLLVKRLTYYSEARIPILYTVHNILPHENPSSFSKSFNTNILKYSNIIIHHGHSSIAALIKEFPECASAHHLVCPLGPYPYVYAESAKSRQMYNLPLSKYIFLNFGFQRKYKGIEFTKEVFNKWNNPNAYLFSIGSRVSDPWKKRSYLDRLKEELLKNSKTIFDRIIYKNAKTITRFIPNEEIPYIMASSDIMFLGHLEGMNSALLSLAVSYGKPVVFPDIGNFKEQLTEWPWQESYKVQDVDSAVKALERISSRIRDYQPGTVLFDNRSWLQTNSWQLHVERITEKIREVYGYKP